MSSGSATPPAEEPDVGPSEDGSANVTVGEYTWADFMQEYGFEDDVEPAYRSVASESTAGLGGILGIGGDSKRVPSDEDWERVSFDPAEPLGFPPDETRDRLAEAARRAGRLHGGFGDWITGKSVSKGRYTWEQFKWEYYYTDAGEVPRNEEANCWSGITWMGRLPLSG